MESKLEHCLLALPASGYVPYVGVFFSRDSELVRVCCIGIALDELESYLHAVGWSGSLAPLQPYTAMLARPQRYAPRPVVGMIHLDVGAEVSSRLGLERQLERAPQLGAGVVDTQLLDRLADAGVCDRVRLDALLRWPGHAIESLPHEIWRSRLVRWVNHVKLVQEPLSGLSVKAYPCAFHGFAPSGRSARRLWTARRGFANRASSS